jgi:hypothetical protein
MELPLLALLRLLLLLLPEDRRSWLSHRCTSDQRSNCSLVPLLDPPLLPPPAPPTDLLAAASTPPSLLSFQPAKLGMAALRGPCPATLDRLLVGGTKPVKRTLLLWPDSSSDDELLWAAAARPIAGACLGGVAGTLCSRPALLAKVLIWRLLPTCKPASNSDTALFATCPLCIVGTWLCIKQLLLMFHATVSNKQPTLQMLITPANAVHTSKHQHHAMPQPAVYTGQLHTRTHPPVRPGHHPQQHHLH